MSFSHTGDFKNFSYALDIKISQDEGQGRTVPILRISLERGAFSLQGGACPERPQRGKILLDNRGNPGKIVIRRGARRALASLIILPPKGLLC
jgi:hypothetical protein